MEWIRVDTQLPIRHVERKLWFFDGEQVYNGEVPHMYKKPEDMLAFLKKYNISHWMPYYPEPPK
jgi:hypothetical protein